MVLMNRQSLVAGVLGLVVLAIVVAAVLYKTKDNRVRVEGQILKVRSHQPDNERTIALVDFRLHNASADSLVVQEIEVFLDEQSASSPAVLFAESDIRRSLPYYPTLGEKHTPGLLRRDRIASGESTDRSIGFSVPVTDDRFSQRKGLRIVIHDVDGAKAEIVEKR